MNLVDVISLKVTLGKYLEVLKLHSFLVTQVPPCYSFMSNQQARSIIYRTDSYVKNSHHEQKVPTLTRDCGYKLEY
jgi:hypothetical protein